MEMRDAAQFESYELHTTSSRVFGMSESQRRALAGLDQRGLGGLRSRGATSPTGIATAILNRCGAG